MNKRATILLLLALAACSPKAAGGSESPPLAGAKLGGPFSLIDQDGRPVTERSFPGRYRAIYFGYSFCPDVCPLDLQRLMKGYRLFAEAHPAAAARLQPIFITVDPARDTPATLKAYVAAFGPPLVGLTGSEAQVAAAAKAFAVYRAKRVEPGSSDYLMDHGRSTMLFDPAGRPMALLPTDADASQVATEMAKWVR